MNNFDANTSKFLTPYSFFCAECSILLHRNEVENHYSTYHEKHIGVETGAGTSSEVPPPEKKPRLVSALQIIHVDPSTSTAISTLRPLSNDPNTPTIQFANLHLAPTYAATTTVTTTAGTAATTTATIKVISSQPTHPPEEHRKSK